MSDQKWRLLFKMRRYIAELLKPEKVNEVSLKAIENKKHACYSRMTDIPLSLHSPVPALFSNSFN